MPCGTTLFHEQEPPPPAEPLLEVLAKQLRPFDASDVRRGDGKWVAERLLNQPIDKKRPCRAVIDGHAKRIVERGEVMHIECDEMCHSGRLQQLGHIACLHRVTRFGASFLARISKIRDESYPRTRTCIAQSSEQKQQTHQTIRYRRRHL